MSLDLHQGAKNGFQMVIEKCNELKKTYQHGGYPTGNASKSAAKTLDTIIDYCNTLKLCADKSIGNIYKEMHEESQEIEKIRESKKDESERV